MQTRPITPADFDFLFELHRQTFYVYGSQTWGWDEERQRSGFCGKLSQSPFEMVQLDSADVGCISVIDRGNALELNYIALLPSVQNRGVGSELVRSLQMQAISRSIPIQLDVLRVNPAKGLYERLGFTVVGSDDKRYHMMWSPQSMIRIRPAQLDDAEQIWQVRGASIWELCANDYAPEQLQAWVGKATLDRYCEIIAEGREFLIVAEAAAEVVGYASLYRAEIYAVHVDPSRARQGIGGQLLAAIEAEAAQRVIALTVDASLTAVPFYQSQGYEILEYTQHRLRSGVQIPCVRMRKQLHSR